MITKRIIPCLDVRNGRVVKGVNFEGVRDVADPVEMARMYNAAGADELVFYDITASVEERKLFTRVLEKVAEQILADYRELTAVPHQGAGGASGNPKRRWRGVPPWLLIVLVLLAIPVGLPLLGVLIGVIGAIAGILLAAVAIAIVVVVIIPLTLLITGVILCGFSFALWGIPASAVTTLGCGLVLFALGVLVTLLMIKLCTLFVPPLFRGFVAIIRWPFDKLRGRTRSNGGGTQ